MRGSTTLARCWSEGEPCRDERVGTLERTTADDPEWATILHSPSALLGLTFANGSHGWAVGRNEILVTTDGGSTWTSQAENLRREIGAGAYLLRAVDFQDESSARMDCRRAAQRRRRRVRRDQ